MSELIFTIFELIGYFIAILAGIIIGITFDNQEKIDASVKAVLILLTFAILTMIPAYWAARYL